MVRHFTRINVVGKRFFEYFVYEHARELAYGPLSVIFIVRFSGRSEPQSFSVGSFVIFFFVFLRRVLDRIWRVDLDKTSFAVSG